MSARFALREGGKETAGRHNYCFEPLFRFISLVIAISNRHGDGECQDVSSTISSHDQIRSYQFRVLGAE